MCIFITSLRNAIKSNPKNWTNCTMFVQDIAFPGINITAEVSRQEALNFKLMCKMFYSNESRPTDVPKATGDKVVNNSQNNPNKAVSSLTNKYVTDAGTSNGRLENEIAAILTGCIQKFKTTLKIIQFGSSQYLPFGLHTNFNFLITTSEYLDKNTKN